MDIFILKNTFFLFNISHCNLSSMHHPPHVNVRVNLDFDICNSWLSIHVLLNTVLHYGALLLFLDSTKWLCYSLVGTS